MPSTSRRGTDQRSSFRRGGAVGRKKRSSIVPAMIHLLTATMLILAFCANIVHFFHQYDRRPLHFDHEPGTIASVVSIGARTGVGEVLAGRQKRSKRP